jgi:hypothetical protein
VLLLDGSLMPKQIDVENRIRSVKNFVFIRIQSDDEDYY